MRGAAPPYGAVFHLEIALLFAALVALGPLARRGADEPAAPRRFGLAELPG
jgi:BCD family chlorophyll transporter-like MFS transporter